MHPNIHNPRSTYLNLPAELTVAELLTSVAGLITRMEGEDPNRVITLSVEPAASLIFESIGLTIRKDNRTLQGPEGVVEPQAHEFELMNILGSQPNIIFTHGQYTNRFRGGIETSSSSSPYKTHIFKLRQKLGSIGVNPEVLKGYRSVGYMLDAGEASSPEILLDFDQGFSINPNRQLLVGPAGEVHLQPELMNALLSLKDAGEKGVRNAMHGGAITYQAIKGVRAALEKAGLSRGIIETIKGSRYKLISKT